MVRAENDAGGWPRILRTCARAFDPAVRQGHHLHPPVGGMRPPLGQAGRLEAVHERRHVGRIAAEVLRQVPHGDGLVGRELEEGLQPARRQPDGVAGLVEALLALAFEDEP